MINRIQLCVLKSETQHDAGVRCAGEIRDTAELGDVFDSLRKMFMLGTVSLISLSHVFSSFDFVRALFFLTTLSSFTRALVLSAL